MATENLTPMMRQFRELKAKHPDAVLLFRCGDFYETYCEDAITAAQVLGITLTHRNNKGVNAQTEMAGFPHHALDAYLPKLIRSGHRVAICDQLEDPKLAKKLVKRGITEVVTPGVALSDNVLDSKENNFLAAIAIGRNSVGLALLDISTGEFAVAEGAASYIAKLFANFSPKELLIERGQRDRIQGILQQRCFSFEMEDWAFNAKTSADRLKKHFNVKDLKGLGVGHMETAVTAAGAVLFYMDDTMHSNLSHITRLRLLEENRYVRLDGFTMRNLEILQPLAEGGRSLLQVIDRTSTPMGARLLRRWLSFPLNNVREIEQRHELVEYFFREPSFRELLQQHLQTIGDMERIVAKLASGRISPREMRQLCIDLQALVPIKQACCEANSDALQEIGKAFHECAELRDRIHHTIVLDPPALTVKGGYIGAGVNNELDELRTLSTSTKDTLLKMQQREIERTGIQSLKIGFNNVFGYYLEVRNTFKSKVPSTWIRRQTLTTGERYITQELKQYEEKILGAEDRILTIEAQLYSELIAAAQAFISEMQRDAALLSQIDCLLSYAIIARERRYIRPVIDESTTLDIHEGRHPVIETEMPAGEQYVPNDVFLDTERQQIIIITGPNMAGKSALLRQTALITLMAQAGSFVPALKAHIGVVDKIFTRVGASDNISAGESTFMVEMSEASSILNSVSNRSLVLFDELGRGTSTYDGISIAWAIVEFLHNNGQCRPRTLFATHYHELNEMAAQLPRVRNYNVSVREVNKRVVFLRKLVEGGSAHSFGIHVAQMAGMPQQIVKRAEEILADLERRVGQADVSPAKQLSTSDGSSYQLSLFQLEDPMLCQIRDTIVNLDINALTPIEALNKLNDIRKLVLTK